MRNLLSRRPSPAMVVALVALFVALGGSAYAFTVPKDSVGTAQLKDSAVTGVKLHDTAVTSSKVKPGSLLANDFKSGQIASGLGPAGGDLTGSYPNLRIQPGAVISADFASDAQTPDSAQLGTMPPSAYGAVLSGRVDGLSITDGTTEYGAASGTTSSPDPTWYHVDTDSPNQDLKARDFVVDLTTSPESGASRTISLAIGNTQTSLSCTLAGVSDTRCTVPGPVDVPAGSPISIEDDVSGSPAHSDVQFAFRLSPQ
jgi:hypothetical protein